MLLRYPKVCCWESLVQVPSSPGLLGAVLIYRYVHHRVFATGWRTCYHMHRGNSRTITGAKQIRNARAHRDQSDTLAVSHYTFFLVDGAGGAGEWSFMCLTKQCVAFAVTCALLTMVVGAQSLALICVARFCMPKARGIVQKTASHKALFRRENIFNIINVERQHHNDHVLEYTVWCYWWC